MKVILINYLTNEILKDYPFVFLYTYPHKGEEVELSNKTFSVLRVLHDYEKSEIRVYLM